MKLAWVDVEHPLGVLSCALGSLTENILVCGGTR
jgi:hypothetical protein